MMEHTPQTQPKRVCFTFWQSLVSERPKYPRKYCRVVTVCRDIIRLIYRATSNSLAVRVHLSYVTATLWEEAVGFYHTRVIIYSIYPAYHYCRCGFTSHQVRCMRLLRRHFGSSGRFHFHRLCSGSPRECSCGGRRSLGGGEGCSVQAKAAPPAEHEGSVPFATHTRDLDRHVARQGNRRTRQTMEQ